MKTAQFCILFAALSATAPADEITAKAKQEAQNCANAVLAQNWETLVRYTHPRAVAKVGGAEAMVATLQRGASEMATEGTKIESARLGQPKEVKKIGGWLTTMAPEHLVMKVPGGHLHADAVLLAISEDENKTWTFVDVGSMTPEVFSALFPELAGKIRLPEMKKPVLKKDG